MIKCPEGIEIVLKFYLVADFDDEQAFLVVTLQGISALLPFENFDAKQSPLKLISAIGKCLTSIPQGNWRFMTYAEIENYKDKEGE